MRRMVLLCFVFVSFFNKLPAEPKFDSSLLDWEGRLSIDLDEANQKKLKEERAARDQNLLLAAEAKAPSWIWFYVLCGGVVLFFLKDILKKIKFFPKRSLLHGRDPQEKALDALRILMEENLLEKGLVDPFYTRLTGICRMFIEDRYQIRAPELTTEEFLVELAASSHFGIETKEQLKGFLDEADLVKFAKQSVSIQKSQRAVELAKEFINNS